MFFLPEIAKNCQFWALRDPRKNIFDSFGAQIWPRVSLTTKYAREENILRIKIDFANLLTCRKSEIHEKCKDLKQVQFFKS